MEDTVTLVISCDKDQQPKVISSLVDNIVNSMVKLGISSLAGNASDTNLSEKIHGLVQHTDDGFIFDANELLGIETYGMINFFFDNFVGTVHNLKNLFPRISIDGYFWFNDLGAYEVTHRVRFHTTDSMDFVDCIGQLQCVKCRKWIDANKAYQLFEDDGEFEFFGDDELLLPNGYMLEGYEGECEAAWCICSAECANELEN